jgi:hypothetical protein
MFLVILAHACHPDNIYIIIMIISIFPSAIRDKTLRGRDIMVVALQLPMQSVSITIDAVCSNLDQDEVYNIMR